MSERAAGLKSKGIGLKAGLVHICLLHYGFSSKKEKVKENCMYKEKSSWHKPR